MWLEILNHARASRFRMACNIERHRKTPHSKEVRRLNFKVRLYPILPFQALVLGRFYLLGHYQNHVNQPRVRVRDL